MAEHAPDDRALEMATAPAVYQKKVTELRALACGGPSGRQVYDALVAVMPRPPGVLKLESLTAFSRTDTVWWVLDCIRESLGETTADEKGRLAVATSGRLAITATSGLLTYAEHDELALKEESEKESES